MSNLLNENLSYINEWFGSELDEQELASKFQVKAAEILKQDFGVEELSTSEGVLLRHCVKRCLDVWAQDSVGNKRGDNSYGASLHTPEREAAYLWLNVAYDVDALALRVYKALHQSASPEFREWLKRTRENATLP